MNTRNALSFILLVGLLFRTSALGAVLLNDTWDDGDRTDTNLPEESAWYGSTAFSTATLSASLGALRGNILMFETNSSSRLWITHFAPTGNPAALAVGDTLKATLVFIPSNVTTSSGTTRGLRIGLFNFSEPGASRVSADGFSTGAGTGAPGTNVTGYILNMNFAETLIANPLQIMKRSVLETNNLMGTTGGGVYTSLGSGGGAQTGPGFQNGVPYTFEFIVKRSETGVEITTRFSDTNGWSMAHTVTDPNNPNMRFDGLALRPNAVADSAQAFTVTQCKVELLPFELRISSIGLLSPFNDTAVSFPTQRGKTYQLEWRANFNPGSSWNSLGEVINGDGAVATRVDSDASFEVERYYRLVELPQ